MDPKELLVALFSAALKSAPSLFQRIGGNRPDKKKIESLVVEKYDSLRGQITTTCFRLLLAAEDGNYRPVYELREKSHPNLGFSTDEEKKRFDSEFVYRLRYLALLGFFTNALEEYYLTELGAAFLAEARRKKDFSDAIHPRP